MKSRVLHLPAAGFTLIEVIVAVVVVGILTALVASGLPSARDSERIILAEQEFQSRLGEARQRSLNEDRSEECLQQFAEMDLEGRQRCSDIGVQIDNRTLTVYADTNGDLAYSPAADYIITATTLAAAATTDSAKNFQFVAIPPTLQLFVDGVEVPNDEVVMRFYAGDVVAAFTVNAAGTLERQPNAL